MDSFFALYRSPAKCQSPSMAKMSMCQEKAEGANPSPEDQRPGPRSFYCFITGGV